MDLSIDTLILRIPAILLALTIHECAHGWVAYKFGDRTAYDSGRVTLNPVAHLDLLGTAMLLFGPFGWAKPVPVDARYFENPKKGILWVSAAGPISNVALALVCGYTFRIISEINPGALHPYLAQFLTLSIMMNAGIAFFNLLPIPPLDGSKILLSLLPNHIIPKYLYYSKHAPTVFMVLLLAEWLLKIPLFSGLIYPLFRPFLSLIQFLIYWNF